MKRTKLAASLMAVTMAAATLLTGCKPSDNDSGNSSSNNTTPSGSNTPSDSSVVDAPKLVYADNTELRMACGYNNPDTGISFDAGTAKEGVKLANGKTYNTGDLKPTWETLQEKLKIKFTDKWTGAGSASKEFDYWKDRLTEVDMVAGSASLLTENGNEGKLVDLSKYLNSMPNFKKYLDENPIVRLSITGSTLGDNKGAIYFSPYFDGVNDIERMPLMRTDWVKKLLNGEGEFTATASNKTAAPKYQPYMPTSGKVDVDIVKADGSGTKKISKDYDKAGNIVKIMNDKGSMDGVEAVNLLRKYIDDAYNGEYGTNRADLFIGQNAAWDADELVALLRCVVANPQTLNGTNTVQGLFSREDVNNQRRVDMFRFAGHLFGVRGLESRQDYLYVGNDGKLVDARQQADTYEALERMSLMAQEGLISKNFIDTTDVDSKKYLENDSGFMSYDYNQTQTAYNDSKLQTGEPDNEEYMAVMVPVARWYDGTKADGVYMRFTESWRSVKTDGWAISAAGVGSDTNKLNAALALIDYAYSPEGQILMSYGPDEFIKKDGDKYVTFSFNGEDWPQIADATRQELIDREGGNYTNYARRYLGSTLSFLKSQAFEYQCTTEIGRKGAGYISTAIGLGTIKHPELAIVSDNMWYTSVPTVLPTTKEENDIIAGFTELSSNGNFSTSKNQKNIFCDIIAGGFSKAGYDKATIVNTVTNDWHGKQYLGYKEQAWQDLLKFYNSNT